MVTLHFVSVWCKKKLPQRDEKATPICGCKDEHLEGFSTLVPDSFSWLSPRPFDFSTHRFLARFMVSGTNSLGVTGL